MEIKIIRKLCSGNRSGTLWTGPEATSSFRPLHNYQNSPLKLAISPTEPSLPVRFLCALVCAALAKPGSGAVQSETVSFHVTECNRLAAAHGAD